MSRWRSALIRGLCILFSSSAFSQVAPTGGGSRFPSYTPLNLSIAVQVLVAKIRDHRKSCNFNDQVPLENEFDLYQILFNSNVSHYLKVKEMLKEPLDSKCQQDLTVTKHFHGYSPEVYCLYDSKGTNIKEYVDHLRTYKNFDYGKSYCVHQNKYGECELNLSDLLNQFPRR